MNIHLGELKKPWIEYCSSVGKKPGAALREAIEKQLAELQGDRPKTVFKPVEEVQHKAKKRFEIMLTDSERDALATRANEENCSGRQFVIDALRAALTHEPQLSMKEIEILGESNFQLLAVGRNLNQIARRLNEGKYEPVTVERIAELRRIIDAHVQKASDSIRANIERWSLR
ncbi:hypothetical protein C660_21385 [Alcaligenes sp. HPC1271]|nr:hypothetical protein C660_21385 [Alcaligenes sp. HPC1271]